jgi:hypothetical protein
MEAIAEDNIAVIDGVTITTTVNDERVGKRVQHRDGTIAVVASVTRYSDTGEEQLNTQITKRLGLDSAAGNFTFLD